MSKYVLGVDAGNTVVKAVLFDLEGRQVAVSSSPGTTSRPQSGHAERDIRQLQDGLCRAISTCIIEAGISPNSIMGVGATGHGNGLYVLDKKGEPLKGIQSIDTRGVSIVESMGEKRDQAHEMSLQKVWSAQTPVLMKWLRMHQPEIIENAGAFLFCKDVIVHYLTGTVGTDVTDAAIGGLLRLPQQTYDSELLGLYELEDLLDRLPHVRESMEIAGYLTDEAAKATGLVAGTPVIAGMIDIVASALGSGVSEPGEASIVAGTWSINQIVVTQPRLDELVFMTTPFGRDRYMVVEASPTSTANLEWFLRELGSDNETAGGAEDCSKLVAGVSPSQDLPVYHPYIYGSSFDGNARGGFYNLGGWHTRADLLYALFEGVTFGHRQHVDNLRHAGADLSKAVLSGGAARSEIWPQLFSDVLSLPITTRDHPETGTLGVSIAVRAALNGEHTMFGPIKDMTSQGQEYSPGHYDKELLESRYEIFNDLVRAMQPNWAKFSQ